MKYPIIWYLFTLLFVITISISCSKNRNDAPKRESNWFKKHSDHLEVYKNNGTYRIKPFADQRIETSFIPKGRQFNSYSHAVIDTSKFTADLTVEADLIKYKTKAIEVRISKNPFRIAYYNTLGKKIIEEKEGYFHTDSTEGLNFTIHSDEVLYGGGARVVGMNRRGKRLRLYNKAHYGYGDQSALMNYTMPLVLSSKKYAIHFDNPAIGYLDFDSQETNTLSYETLHNSRMTYQIVVGDTWQQLLDEYTTLTGKQPMPPRWVFGNFASRFGYHSQTEVMNVVQKFKKDRIPLDAVILDIFWFGKEIKGEMGNLSFLKDSFPSPKKMIADLREEGVKTVLITEPFILKTSSRWEEAIEKDILAKDKSGQAYEYDFYFGNTGLIDIFSPKGKNWFWNFYKNFTEDYDIAGWWGDLGEPEVHPSDLKHHTGTADQVHNIYGHQWAKLLNDGYAKDFKKQRPFILMRAGYSGSQRFGMIPWSGDVHRSWKGLQSQNEIALAMGIQGLAYMHSDLGGICRR